MTTESELVFHPSVIIPKTATVEGAVTFGAGCVVHPGASIRAISGPIEFGENNLIEEMATIENTSVEPMKIGANNVFEIGSVVRASTVGEHNVFGVRCVVDPGAAIPNGCFIGARCVVHERESLPDRTVIYGENNEERIAHDDPPNSQVQLELLRKIIPSYHHIVKKK